MFLVPIDRIGANNALKCSESKGLQVAKDVRREMRDPRAKVAVGVSVQRAIKVATKQSTTTEGRRTWQTLLTAAAFRRSADGDVEGEEEED